MYKHTALTYLMLVACSYILFSASACFGLFIINNTGKQISVRINTQLREYQVVMVPQQRYLLDGAPQNMAVYMPDGSVSQFNNITMNIAFTEASILPNGPHCVLLRYSGKSRQQNPTYIQLTFRPLFCKRNNWNPALHKIDFNVTKNPTAPISQPFFIINNTNQAIGVRVSGALQEYWTRIAPNKQYPLFELPHNIVVYGAGGQSSTFYNIGMNPRYNQVHILQHNGHMILGYPRNPRVTRPSGFIIFEPDHVTPRGWNATTGAVYSEFSSTTSAATPATQ